MGINFTVEMVLQLPSLVDVYDILVELFEKNVDEGAPMNNYMILD